MMTRLRASREIYRDNNRIFSIKNEVLKAKFAVFAVKEEEKEVIAKLLDSDLNEAEQPVKLKIFIFRFIFRFIKRIVFIDSDIDDNNKRYFDVSNYYGDKVE